VINRKLILANAPKDMNEQVHVNHIGCSSGDDKKKRLYIKRTSRGLVAYCHHCCESGFASDDASGRLGTWLTPKEAIREKLNTPLILSDVTFEGKVWLCTNYCDPTNPNFSGVRHERNKVALALHNPEQQIIGWQVRNLVPNAVPKYLTSYDNGSNNGDASWFHTRGSKTLVMTEDYLSAHRVFTDTGLSSIALLRTSVSDRTLSQIHELNFEFIYIWLDPDQAGIDGARKAIKKLTHFLPTSTSIKNIVCDREPKQHTKDELYGLLNPASL
jgi:hypothetical protein